MKQTSRSGTQKQTQEEDEATEKAIREAEAARRVQDLKNGRIDHEGNWSDEGQKLEGGDSTKLVDTSEVSKAWGLEAEPAKDPAQGKEKPREPVKEPETREEPVSHSFESFKNDLYKRLGTSFQAIERTLSDLQGRVSEIVTASAKNAAPPPDEKDAESEFEELLSRDADDVRRHHRILRAALHHPRLEDRIGQDHAEARRQAPPHLRDGRPPVRERPRRVPRDPIRPSHVRPIVRRIHPRVRRRHARRSGRRAGTSSRGAVR